MAEILRCAVCASDELILSEVAQLRVGYCKICHHSQRVDIPSYDYRTYAMAVGAITAEVLNSQATFISSILPKNSTAIEIGCSSGDLARALRKMHEFRRYDGVELSPAKEMAADILDKVFDAPVTDLLNNNQLSEAEYDIVLTSHCLEHVDDVHQMIADMKRLLKPDGVMFIEVPNRSGHKALPFDDNRSHLHFFSVSSLSRLLSAHGLDIRQAQTSAWHCARGADCLRVLATSFTVPPSATTTILSDSSLLSGENELVVWPAGNMSEELLAHFFDPSRIAFFVDSNNAKHGTVCLGRPVRSPEAIAESKECAIFINSLDFEGSIRNQILEQFPGSVRKIVTMREVLTLLSPDKPPNN